MYIKYKKNIYRNWPCRNRNCSSSNGDHSETSTQNQNYGGKDDLFINGWEERLLLHCQATNDRTLQ